MAPESLLVLIVGGILLLFALVVLRGAPYVPTLKRTVQNALDVLDLEAGDVVVDLGSGDGAFLKAAATRGLRAVGYEINPLLCVIARLRCWRERHFVSIKLRDFWLADLPPDTKAVFVFLAGPYMQRLKRKLDIQMAQRDEPLTVVSNGFAIPGLLPRQVKHGLYVYTLEPRT